MRNKNLPLSQTLSLLMSIGLVAGCTPSEPSTPKGPPPDLAASFADAFEKEAKDATSAAPYLDTLDKAVGSPDAPNALAAAMASLDALVFGAASADIPSRTGVAYRSRDNMKLVVDRLRAAWAHAEGPSSPNRPVIRGAIAAGLHELALYSGDENAADVWGTRRGCAAAGTVIGPYDASPLENLEGPSPVDAKAPLAATYPGLAPFATKITPTAVRADQCLIDVNAGAFLPGSRAIVIDLDNGQAQRITLSLTSSSAASVEVGGVPLMRRAFDLGGRSAITIGSVHAEQGRVRVVVRVAQKGDGAHIELDAIGEDGLPLRAHAPEPGDIARAAVKDPQRLILEGRTSSPNEMLVTGAGLLALGDPRAAEHLLETTFEGGTLGQPKSVSPALQILYGRAMEAADDLPDNKLMDRSKLAVEGALAAWPSAWEARLAHARATERRRGSGDGTVEALTELGYAPNQETTVVAPRDRMIAAYVAMVARRAGMEDVSAQAYADVTAAAPDSPLAAGVDIAIHTRFGVDAMKVACLGLTSRAELGCFDLKRDLGDYKGALDELARLRRLRRGPDALRDQEMNVRIHLGDVDGALALYDAMLPGQRRLIEGLGLAAGRGQLEQVRRRLNRDQLTAGDAPYGITPLTRLLGIDPDPAPRFEAEGKKIVEADRQKAYLPGAATAVLRHLERYSIEANGFVRYQVYDLRRVAGTTDVAMGGFMYGPMIDGRGAPRQLRRRIHKHEDGRVIEPDVSERGRGSDLSQLERGDYVETMIEGTALPGDSGQLVLDTPDLLPERTSVREGEIEIRRPSNIAFQLWSHPLLGKAEEREERGSKVSTWRLKDAPPRRFEDGVPRVERSVSVSMGTQTWALVARAMKENLRSLDDRDPYVTRWAKEAAGEDVTPSKELVERVVAAAGKKIKLAGGGELSDMAAIFGGGSQHAPARMALELGQGSRSWVIYRALRELGIRVDLAIAEQEPFSSSPDFPVHVGRFRKPLVIAHLPKEGDLWIDADVDGPPLPPGHVSPELRGRQAMVSTGDIVAVAGSTSERDEIDVRLALDDKGSAKGTFTILLHGMAAQGLSDAFETVVGTERRDMLRRVVLGWLPWANVDDVTVSSKEGSWEVALRASITIPGYARFEGKGGKTWVLPGLEPVHGVFPSSYVTTLGAMYTQRGERESDLSIENTIQYHVHRHVDLPAGASIVKAPAGIAIDDPRVGAERKYSAQGSSIDESFSLSLPTGTVKAKDYRAFVEKVRSIDETFLAGARVQVAGGGVADAKPTAKPDAKPAPKPKKK